MLPLQGDLADFDAATRVVNECVKSFGKVDLLVNNAGITRYELLSDMTPDGWERSDFNEFGFCVQYDQKCD